MKFSIFALLACVAVSSHAGPFGLDQGLTLKELQAMGKLKTEGNHTYSTPTLPDAHPDFTDYRLVVTPTHGLCKVTAWSSSIRSSVYGNELLSQFDRFFEALTNKYGPAKRYDHLRAGSIWNDSRDWMMALAKRERTLVAYWLEKDQPLPDNLAAIKIEAFAASTNSGLLSISYEFKNADECIDWIKKQRDSKL
jgi:hypothetical protein